MFFVWEKQYCQNYNIAQSNLQITQSNSYQISNVTFHRIRAFFFNHLYGNTKDPV